MRLLADECCPSVIVAALRDDGHDVRHALESHRGKSDAEIAHIAELEDRIIVTEDYDFGEMAIRHRLPMPGLILLAFNSEPHERRILRLRSVLAEMGEELRNYLTIVSVDRLRRRSLRED